MSTRPKDKRSTFARPVIKLDKYPKKGRPHGDGTPNVCPFGNELEFSKGIKQILDAYPAIGKGSGLTDKVVVVGDQNVGKTCLVLRYCENTYADNYKATIGVDFVWQRYLIQQIGFTLHLWDTAGQEKFRSLSQAYYRGARGCIVAFDFGNADSLINCKHWVSEVKAENHTAADEGDFSVFLVGCKSDTYKVVDENEAEKVARELGAEYFEVSAKQETGVKELFERVAIVLFGKAVKRAAEAMRKAQGGGPDSTSVNLGTGKSSLDMTACC